jgi:hypothetical protein
VVPGNQGRLEAVCPYFQSAYIYEPHKREVGLDLKFPEGIPLLAVFQLVLWTIDDTRLDWRATSFDNLMRAAIYLGGNTLDQVVLHSYLAGRTRQRCNRHGWPVIGACLKFIVRWCKLDIGDTHC